MVTKQQVVDYLIDRGVREVKEATTPEEAREAFKLTLKEVAETVFFDKKTDIELELDIMEDEAADGQFAR